MESKNEEMQEFAAEYITELISQDSWQNPWQKISAEILDFPKKTWIFGTFFGWTRRESNPCPKTNPLSFYECSLFFDIPSTGLEQTRFLLQ